MELLSALENVLEELTQRVRGDAALTAELAASREPFFGGPVPTDGTRADQAIRRHLEWFLFERVSPSLDGAPVEQLREHWSERLGDDEEALATALLGSLCGIFEVTGVEPGSGIWLRDLLGGGEYPLSDPDVTSAFAVGDILAGRIFPVGESTFYASPAAAAFRNAALLHALRDDMQALRNGRRGSLRISQVELERMFFGAGAVSDREDSRNEAEAQKAVRQPAVETPDAHAAREAARSYLAASGFDSADLESSLQRLWGAPFDAESLVHGVDDELGELLDRLAIETQVDLGEARRLLLAAWTATSAQGDASAPTNGMPTSGILRPVPAPRPTKGSGVNPREALAEFDRGRAEGQDLDALFDRLERDLGLADDSGADDEQAPDFPGVVGAMVEEMLWETQRTEGDEARNALEPLRGFAQYAAEIGVFENLSARDLLTFTCIWSIEEGGLRSPELARQVLAATASFARWCEREHDLPLWKDFRADYEELQESLPRIALANAYCVARPASQTDLHEFVEDALATVWLSDRSGERIETTLEDEIQSELRPGDLLRTSRDGASLTVAACYPARARRLLFGD